MFPRSLATASALGTSYGHNLTRSISTDWAGEGLTSFRLEPGVSTDCSLRPESAEAGALRTGMLPGRTYTFVGDIYIPTDLGPGAHPTRSGAIQVFWSTIAGGGSQFSELSSGALTSAGTYRNRRVTVQIPANATAAFVRFYNGSTTQPVYWDRLGMFEGSPPAGWWCPPLR